tara:strand:+ start:2496 stop:3251 length:756 start_codon:yes stop_codon:yes gene_type:complete
MIRVNHFLFIVSCLILTSCNSKNHQFPLDKRYWDPNDYDKVGLELRFNYESDEKLPTFDNPKNKLIVEKLTDEQNFKIVLEDDELGLKHRNEVAEKFFAEWKDMSGIYTATDRQDKYLYDIEMLAVWHFGLGLQLRYFKLGNDLIKESADDPDAQQVKSSINSNVNILINNYLFYLDEVNNENAFTEAGKVKFAGGIDNYYSELIKLYPNADYSGMKTKAELMLKKSESESIKTSLEKLISLIAVAGSPNL